MRKEARILDHVPDPTPQPDQVPGGRGCTLDQDGTGAWQEQAVHHFQGGGLARPAAAQEDQGFPGFDIEIEIVKDIFLTDANRNLSEGDKRTHELMVNLLFSITLFPLTHSGDALDRAGLAMPERMR